MSSLSFLVDPYADTLEMPVSGEFETGVGRMGTRANRPNISVPNSRSSARSGAAEWAIVFLARDIALHRLVAIKVLRYEFTSSDEHRERFRREARMTARLSHSNIVPLHTFGEIPADDASTARRSSTSS